MTPREQADAAAWAIVAAAECCDYCRVAPASEAHEILRGTGLRRLARGKKSCTLALCRDCHNRMGGMSWEKQILILFTARPDDSNVKEFWKIANRGKPTVEELLAEAMRWGAERAIRRER